jgi:hypothetical protein
MRRRLSDPHIAASDVSAVDNIRQFIGSDELGEGRFALRSWDAALQIAADLTKLCRQHAAERLAGARRW